MKSLVFDSSSIITLTMNNLLYLLRLLKKNFNVNLYIPRGVKEEIIDRPMKSKRFKFGALMVVDLVKDGYLDLIQDERVDALTKRLLYLSNHIFSAKGSWIKILHKGEMAALALTVINKAEVFVVDERTTRMIVENPKGLAELLHKKLHTYVSVNEENLSKFLNEVKGVNIIRSSEVVTFAFEKGLLDDWITSESKKIASKHLRKELLDALLWGVKLRGCSISVDEINRIKKLQGF